MLVYRIKSPQASAEIGFLDKKAILDRALDKSWFAVGDHVKFKKPKRGVIKGVITHIEKDWNLVTWTNGGQCPNNISIQIEEGRGFAKGLIAKTNAKKIIHLE